MDAIVPLLRRPPGPSSDSTFCGGRAHGYTDEHTLALLPAQDTGFFILLLKM